ncbi:exported hypothetical protein [Xanthomonas phaseoli pv. phaseoli]|nr:exported hypothetical protein [Xanthomonas phaseoli pv. phaseoli]
MRIRNGGAAAMGLAAMGLAAMTTVAQTSWGPRLFCFDQSPMPNPQSQHITTGTFTIARFYIASPST